jgi:hypothetical protein
MQLRFWMTASAAVCAVAMIGCGSSEKTADQGPNYTFPDTASFCNGVAKAMCSDSFVGACGGAKDACAVNMQKSVCQKTSGSYRPVTADDCVKAYKDAYDDGKITGDEQAIMTKACTIVFGGTGGTGAPCSKLTDCNLDDKLECVKGKCEIPVLVGAGEDCSADDKNCNSGYYCTPADKICGKAPALGGACDDATKPCQDTLRCVSGTCQDKIQDGTTCVADVECLSKLCIPVPGGDAGAPAYRCSSTRVFSPYDPVCIEAATP